MSRWPIAVLALMTAPLSAQQDSLMREAVRLATEGQSDSAQSILRGRLLGISPMDARYPEVLFTAGLVASDADSASAYFRQVSIEYSNSEWADRALLRLAQLAYARGNLMAAYRSADRVLSDYPFSEVRAAAAFLAARTQFDMRNAVAGCQLLEQARSEAGHDVELANRAAFYIQRCRMAVSDDSSGTSESPTAPIPPSTGRFSVQVAAVSSAAAADEVMRGLQESGYQPTVFREDGLLKIRVGNFNRRREAQTLAAELKRLMGGEPFVVERR